MVETVGRIWHHAILSFRIKRWSRYRERSSGANPSRHHQYQSFASHLAHRGSPTGYPHDLLFTPTIPNAIC